MKMSELMQNILNRGSNYVVLPLLYGYGTKGKAYDICLMNDKSNGIESVFCFGHNPDDGWRLFYGRDITSGNVKKLSDSLSKYVEQNSYVSRYISEIVKTYNLINDILKRDDLDIWTDAYFVSSDEYRMISGEIAVRDETTDIFYGTYNDHHERCFVRPLSKGDRIEPHQTEPLNMTKGMAALVEYSLCDIVLRREREQYVKQEADHNWLNQFVLPVNCK